MYGTAGLYSTNLFIAHSAHRAHSTNSGEILVAGSLLVIVNEIVTHFVSYKDIHNIWNLWTVHVVGGKTFLLLNLVLLEWSESKSDGKFGFSMLKNLPMQFFGAIEATSGV